MTYKKVKKAQSFKKAVSMLTASVIAFGCYGSPVGIQAAEQAEKTYKGIGNAQVVLNNLDFQDVRSSGTWAAEAIYETGALDVIKGYGDKRFGRTDIVTKEQAIAIAYRVAGREADAQKAAEALDNARVKDEKKKDVLGMWSDGYLKLAADDGLISAQDLQDALNSDPSSLEAGSFYRSAPAQRQEMAFWLAKALKLQPTYGQQTLFNSYKDWRSSDPVKLPYIETVLQNQIMNGNGNGYFNPTQSLKREEVAQIVKNASDYMLPTLKYERHTGTIEDINFTRTMVNGQRMENALLNIRNINGKLHTVNVGYINDPAQSDRNEQNGQILGPTVLDLVVYKNGVLSNSDVLVKGDRIEYIVGPDNTVKYVEVFSSTADTKYIVAQVKNIHSDTLTMDISQFFTMETPDMELAQQYINFEPKEENPTDSYVYSNGVSVKIGGVNSDIKNLKPDAFVVLTIVNDVVTVVETFDLRRIREAEKGIVGGMVEENNPQLGYITLYREDGTGTSPEAAQAGLLRTYNYSGQKEVQVYKNHKKADISEIAAGDSVFLKLDDQLNVVAVSAVSNYMVKYAKVMTKGPYGMALEYEDGTQQVLDIGSDTLVIAQGKIADYGAIREGDKIRLVMQITGNSTRIKEITVSDSENLISNLYKGVVSHIDEVSNSVVLQNVEVLNGDRWQRIDQKGFTSIPLAERNQIYLDNQGIDTDKVNQMLRDSQAYIAVEKDYGGTEKVVVISFRNSRDAEIPVVYDDTVAGIGQSLGQFTLNRESKNIKYSKGTIVVKDGKLVSGSSIKSNDAAYVVASRSNTNGELYAGIVNIGERFAPNTLQVYRGRIKQINNGRDFTVESFSELNNLQWNYWNTPKTFSMTYNTRILDNSGVVNPRDFITYGQGSFQNKTVYVVAKDGEALLVSTAPFTNPFHIKGEIYAAGSGTDIKLWNAKVYDPYNYLWKDSNEITLTLLKNSIVIKEGKVINASELKKGDRIRAIKKDNTTTGEAYILFVEN